MVELKFKIDQLFETYSQIMELAEKEDNFNLILDEDISTLNSDDLNKYKAFLNLVANIIISEHGNGRYIAVDVLTDIFNLKQGTLPDDSGLYLYCNHCPCYHCQPNDELFEKTTGIKYLPCWQYCTKSFFELETSKMIADELSLNIDISDIDFSYLEWITENCYGNQLVTKGAYCNE